MIKAGTYPKQDKDVPGDRLLDACRSSPATCPRTSVYKMTKAMADDTSSDMAAVVKPIDGAHAEGHGGRHRRAACTRARRKYYKEVGAM